jgi:chromosome segregation ATPase
MQNRISEPRTPPSNNASNSAEVLEYLREMRTEVRNDLSSIKNKIDDININMNQLKAENESLKEENKRLWSEIDIIKKKTDKLEGHSRRNNIRIIGIEGSLNESWSETERKVRDFITSDLNMPGLEHVEIERAHRMQSRYENKITVIVKFSRFKDKETILNQARQVLHNESTRRVHEDFTDRVKLHRRELGKRLVHARENGQYASMNYDKLIIENTVYGYDEEKKDSYIIGHARGNPGTKFHQRRRRVNTGDGYQQTDDGQETQTVP